MELKNIKTVEEIVNMILPNHFTFMVHQSEFQEDGSFTKEYTTKAQNIYDDLLQLLNKNYKCQD